MRWSFFAAAACVSLLFTRGPASAQKPPEPVRAQPGTPVKIGDIEVSIVSVKNSDVTIRRSNDIGSSFVVRNDPHLIIRIEVRNISETRKTNYATWNAGSSLWDEFENRYKRVDPGIGFVITDAMSLPESLYPEKLFRDILVFELPIEKATTAVASPPTGVTSTA